jgi:GT2 family glycosyltransferase
MNMGVNASSGEFLILLNDDIEILTHDWIEKMLAHFEKQHVGVVGARLLYPDGKIQHAGVVSVNGSCDHVRRFYPGDEAGYFFSTSGARNYQAVTGAAMLVRKNVYQQVKGFCPDLPVNLNDIDFCFKVRKLGLTVVYEPRARLEHMESQSRVFEDRGETEIFQERWAEELVKDPYYNEEFFSENPPKFNIAIK